MAIERELKFSTSDDHVPGTLELELALTGSGLGVAAGRVTRHVDVYYDVDGLVAAAGAALRIRHSSGRSRATLKTERRVSGTAAAAATHDTVGIMHERSELEAAIDHPASAVGESTDTASPVQWPAELVAALPAGVKAERLEPVVELRIRRVAFLVTADPGAGAASAPVAELAFDEVTVAMPGAGGGAAPTAVFHEVEIESLTGDDVDSAAARTVLQTVAAAVGTVVGLTASPVAKLDRARALLAALEGG